MNQAQALYKSRNTLFLSYFLFVLVTVTQPAFAEGIFINKDKGGHQLSGAELNRIKAEHQLRFGSRASNASNFSTNNPWEKKKQKTQRAVNKASWGDCRDYALHKRNRCYREGRDAYRCEQMYETRARLCDSSY